MAGKKSKPRAAKKSVRTPKKDDQRGKNPHSLANLKAPWKPGDPSPNPSGRPKLLGQSYRAMLEQVDETDPQKRTNAELIAYALGKQARAGDVAAAKEIRAATEGEKITLTTWQTEMVNALKAGDLTAEDLINELGYEDARPILIAAGQVVLSAAPKTDDGKQETNP